MVSQEQFDELSAKLVNQEQFEELRLKLVAYESQQADNQAGMQQEVKNQVSEVSDGLKELYTVANIAVGAVATRVTKIEESLAEQRSRGGGAMQGQRSLSYHKNMTVAVLEKMDQWRSWTADVEDYTEETVPGIRLDLDTARNQDEEVAEVSGYGSRGLEVSRDGLAFFEEVYLRRGKEGCMLSSQP